MNSQGNSDSLPISSLEKAGRGEFLAQFRCSALATDYDGTLATHGIVHDTTREALCRFRATGRKVILVTGRRISELSEVYPHLDDFDGIVAENGATLYWPADQREDALAEAPPMEFVELLAKAGAHPIERGTVIVATLEPHQHAALDAIQKLGLELQVIFNKGSVMILPSGVNKATGLAEALKIMKIPREEVAGVGDAENDHALLEFCGLSAAVANALPVLKEHARLVLTNTHGEGVAELIDLLLGQTAKDAPGSSAEIHR